VPNVKGHVPTGDGQHGAREARQTGNAVTGSPVSVWKVIAAVGNAVLVNIALAHESAALILSAKDYSREDGM
jgi:hypothetical protein